MYKRKRTALTQKRTYKRAKSIAKNVKYNKAVGLLGVNPKASFRYTENFQIVPTIRGMYAFSVNSLYDPNVTGTGHQPKGFDQIMLLYDHYLTMKCNYKITFINESSTVPCVVGCALSRLTTDTYSGIDDFSETTNADTHYLNLTGTSSNSKVVKGSVIPHRFLGSKNPMGNDRLWGETATSPQENLKLHLFVSSADESQNPVIRIIIELSYFAVLREPQNVNQS